jgi:rRNA processing protein Gar1
VSQDPKRLGICTTKTQGKILVQIKEGKLPKIGTRTVVKRNGAYREIGEIIEVIGSTRSPWIVIAVKKEMYPLVSSDDVVYIGGRPVRKKTKRMMRRKKGKKTQKTNI